MGYNILNGGEGRENYILHVLQTVQPDVAILQEVYHQGFVQNLGQLLGMRPFFLSGNKKRHVALLSRLPVISCQSYHPFPPIWTNVVEAEIELRQGSRLRLFGLHHLANLSIINEYWRWWEAKRIIERAKAHLAGLCLIAGDFNAIAPGDRIVIASMPQWLKLILLAQGNRAYHFSLGAYLSAGFTDCFRTVHPDDDGFTLPPPQPNARLDYILANAAILPALRDCRVVREPAAVPKASDHYPVVAEFEA